MTDKVTTTLANLVPGGRQMTRPDDKPRLGGTIAAILIAAIDVCVKLSAGLDDKVFFGILILAAFFYDRKIVANYLKLPKRGE